MWAWGSDWQSCGQHLIGEFASAGGVEFAAQKAPDLGGFGVELFGQVACAGALHLARDHEKVGRAGMMTTSPGPRASISLRSFGRSCR
jgi:hypothetical protein